jgi:putative transcription factor
MGCEICNSDRNLVDAIVESAVVKVCEECKHFGQIIVIEPPKVETPRVESRRLAEEEISEFVVDDFGMRIKKAREELELRQEELGREINEKASLISKFESGILRPSLSLARKLEKFLDIKLIEEYKDKPVKLDFKRSNLTIADLVKIKEKKE